jgi:alpha-D-xyloside xylohydrolase
MGVLASSIIIARKSELEKQFSSNAIINKQMALAPDKGIPPMRPVFFDFDQIDPKTAEIEDQFLFGPDLLVAPITRFGQRSREVYLPGGVDWTDAWTGKKFKGGQTIKADAPIERIPVCLRGDQPKLLKLFKEKAPEDLSPVSAVTEIK